MGPSECKYCKCGEIRSETDSAIHFKCFSSYWHDGDEWNIATNCAAKCAVQLVELRERVQQAVEVLERAERYEPVIDQHGGIDWLDIPEGTMMLSQPANQAIAILKGETDGKTD